MPLLGDASKVAIWHVQRAMTNGWLAAISIEMEDRRLGGCHTREVRAFVIRVGGQPANPSLTVWIRVLDVQPLFGLDAGRVRETQRRCLGNPLHQLPDVDEAVVAFLEVLRASSTSK